MFQPGTLWQRIVATSEQARQQGALLPIATRAEVVPDHGIPFLVRVVENLARKPRPPLTRGDASGPRVNPFLPYDRQLYVADASTTHVCLLNKFNVVDHHLLIVTRHFEDQESPLTEADFAAWWTCLREYEGLGFYNSGAVAGASQRHKHLQIVPLPLAAGLAGTPIDPWLLPRLQRPREPAAVTTIDLLPFAHAAIRVDPAWANDPAGAAARTLPLYRQMLQRVGLSAEGAVAGDYNLLVTRHWMLLVRRRYECVDSISLNAMAFAGALLVRDDEQLERVRELGPWKMLIAVAAPRA